MKQNDEIEDLFASTFDDFSVEPPPNVKVNIDKQIKRKGFNSFWIIIPIVTLVLSVTGFLFYINSKTESILNHNHPILTSSNSTSSASQNTENSDSSDTVASNPAERTQSDSNSTSKSSQSDIINTSEQQQLNNMKVTTSHSVAQKSSTKKTGIQKVKNTSFPFDGSDNTKKEGNGFVTKNPKSNEKSKKSKNPIDESSLLNSNNSEQFNSIQNKKGTEKTVDTPNEKTPSNGKENEGQPNHITTDSMIASNTGQNSESKEKNSVENSENLASENKTSLTDSTSKTNAVISNTVTDSLKNSVAESVSSPADSLITPPTPSWLLSVRAGSWAPQNKFSNGQFSTWERYSFFINAEARYSFNNKYGIESGLQYSRFVNQLSYKTTTNSSVINGYDTTFIYSPADSSITDTICTPNYQTLTTEANYHQVYNVSSIGIPIYFSYTSPIVNKWYMDANLGVLLSYQQAKKVSGDFLVPEPTIRSFGIKICAGVQARYQFDNRFGISFYENICLVDLAPTLNWSGTKVRRIYYDFGIGLHYQF